MKKIIAFLLSVIIAYTPTLIFAADKDDIDFQNRYQTGNWKHDKVTPYSTAGSTQPDYYNSSKYNVSSSRDVTSNGSKYKQTVNVAVEVSKAEKAATIANRAKNMAEYAKKLGKASLPAFVGSAALTGLIEGIGWVMGEGGQITKAPDSLDDSHLKNSSQYIWYYVFGGKRYSGYSKESACLKADLVPFGNSCKTQSGSMTISMNYMPNPDYISGSLPSEPSPIPVSNAELETSLKNALESNNPALAAAIAQAVKDAFSESDLDKNPNTGTKDNPIADKTKKALDEKGAAELKEDADPTVCVPNVGDLQSGCTSMPKSEADALPALKCVRGVASDVECTYVVDPDAPTKPGTIEKPSVNPETGELPEACVWFDVHCKWLEWTKEELDQDNTETEVQEKERDFDFDVFKKDRFTVSRQCPAPIEHTIELSGVSASFSFDLKPLCDVLEMARPALVACSYLYAAYIVIGAARNG
ncbi:virulence factor TspB C-terminal domain-related protein [Acinetobacter sp. YH12208]|uniref:virulence factor TspB C-terminal domain-related protein n=1 Tax=Acinetobacter sp. YH12208 TaxID=2601144 RepID=UPI0015D30A2A|nr:virulence factor TspB C-terminal domain-related protein [Acinetobacter sp. YH12208]